MAGKHDYVCGLLEQNVFSSDFARYVLGFCYRSGCSLIGPKGQALLTELAVCDRAKEIVLTKYPEELVRLMLDLSFIRLNERADMLFINGELFRAYVCAVL